MNQKNVRKNKVLVALSGGVDSSVCAALLKKAGFYPELGRRIEVAGAFMKLADSPKFKDGEKNARKVSRVLKIPFFVLDLRKEFKKIIIDCFLCECKKGNTPNPCVVCNKEIKFGLLLEKAKSSGFDFLATGHYVRLKNGVLLKGKDKEKDQSYFLWELNQKQLKSILFPLGDHLKSEVRKMARKFELPTSENPGSQEICFVPKNASDFLKDNFASKPGKIIDNRLKLVGEHKGLFLYTIGQRKGIGLAGGPYFVLNKDLEKNILIVTKNEKDLLQKELLVRNVNWIAGKEPKLPLRAQIKIRYRGKPVFASIVRSSVLNRYKVIFNKPQRAITPGQSAVFYSGSKLLGGGIII